jgi:hypothetical protein
MGLYIVRDLPPILPIKPPFQKPQSIVEAFHQLYPALQHICGNLMFPADNGQGILATIHNDSLPLYESSDASLNTGRASHAWYVSTGKAEHLEVPMFHIKGGGPVDGLPKYLSSLRGELTGITAVAIISKLLFDYHLTRKPLHIKCDNQGAINRCAKGSFSSLGRQRDANIDLYLTQHAIHSSLPISYQWVKSHRDNGEWDSVVHLVEQQLSTYEIYNVWCDRASNIAWEQGFPSHSNPDITPTEKWALFSCRTTYHKLIGELNHCIYDSLGYQQLLSYNFWKA